MADLFTDPPSASTISLWPAPDLQINFFPDLADHVDFDLDIRETRDQAQLDRLCDALHTRPNRGQGHRHHTRRHDLRPFLVYSPTANAILMARSDFTRSPIRSIVDARISRAGDQSRATTLPRRRLHGAPV